MIKTLIVDDDIEMLQGLENIISWEKYGFTIVGKADNGAEALELVKATSPDLIITDITMPALNGLELVREAKKLNPELRAILLTCHENFNFAKEAIELAVEDYLVKYTLTEEDLVTSVLKVKEKWHSEQRQKVIQKELNLNKELVRDRFFMDIINHNFSDYAELDSTANLLNIALPNRSFLVLGLFIDNFEHLAPELTIFHSRIENMIETTISSNLEISFFSYNEYSWMLICWMNLDPIIMKQKTMTFAQELQKNIFQALNFNPSITLSSSWNSITQLDQPVQEALTLREGYFYSGPGTLLFEPKVFKNNNPGEFYKKYEASLKVIMETGDEQKMTQLMEEFFAEIKRNDYSPNGVKLLFRRLLVDLEAAAGRYGITFADFNLNGDTLSQYQTTLLTIIRFFFKKQSEIRDSSFRKEINMVVEYINNHLNEDISCEKMAKFVNMNSSYFSRLFKNELGISFSDYLINRRMDLASTLLASSDSTIEEIAKAIGIENISYFYRAYKRATGKTPGKTRSQSHL